MRLIVCTIAITVLSACANTQVQKVDHYLHCPECTDETEFKNVSNVPWDSMPHCANPVDLKDAEYCRIHSSSQPEKHLICVDQDSAFAFVRKNGGSRGVWSQMLSYHAPFARSCVVIESKELALYGWTRRPHKGVWSKYPGPLGGEGDNGVILRMTAETGSGATIVIDQMVKESKCAGLREYSPGLTRSEYLNQINGKAYIDDMLAIPRHYAAPNGSIFTEAATGGSEHICYVGHKDGGCIAGAYVNYQQVESPTLREHMMLDYSMIQRHGQASTKCEIVK